nr:LLM class flavin-dependent oxidoreductase [Bradyrhizobium sp. 177]
MSALSSRTRDIELVATAPTTHYQSYHLARMFASLDHLSRGRAAWNILAKENFRIMKRDTLEQENL